MECPSAPPAASSSRRPNRTGTNRRSQDLRFETRVIQYVLKAFDSLNHRGCAKSAFEQALSRPKRPARDGRPHSSMRSGAPAFQPQHTPALHEISDGLSECIVCPPAGASPVGVPDLSSADPAVLGDGTEDAMPLSAEGEDDTPMPVQMMDGHDKVTSLFDPGTQGNQGFIFFSAALIIIALKPRILGGFEQDVIIIAKRLVGKPELHDRFGFLKEYDASTERERIDLDCQRHSPHRRRAVYGTARTKRANFDLLVRNPRFQDPNMQETTPPATQGARQAATRWRSRGDCLSDVFSILWKSDFG